MAAECLLFDHEICLGVADGDASLTAEILHALDKLLRVRRRQRQKKDVISIYQTCTRHLEARIDLHAIMLDLAVKVIIKSVKESPQQCRAVWIAMQLSYTVLLSASRPVAPAIFMEKCAAGIPRLNGQPHLRANSNGLQATPQELMLDDVVGLLEVHRQLGAAIAECLSQ